MTNHAEAYELLATGRPRPVELPKSTIFEIMDPHTIVQVPTEHDDFSTKTEVPLDISLQAFTVDSGVVSLRGISANVPYPHSIHIEKKRQESTGEIRLEQVLPKTLREAHQKFLKCAVPYELFPDAPITYHEDTGPYAESSATTVKLASGREIRISDTAWGEMHFTQPSKDLDTTEYVAITSIDGIPKIEKGIMTENVGIVSWDCSEDPEGVEAVESAIALLEEAMQTVPSQQAEYASLVDMDMRALYGEEAVWSYYAKRTAEESAKRPQRARIPVADQGDDIPF